MSCSVSWACACIMALTALMTLRYSGRITDIYFNGTPSFPISLKQTYTSSCHMDTYYKNSDTSSVCPFSGSATNVKLLK
ncbi:hypothetical protein CBFG_03397 [Clostridiales bacterium 1_7_47FAA]|nr:hypothetical protein CBFG_03397 [Clostridiales bacterium 1_7_47FAA]